MLFFRNMKRRMENLRYSPQPDQFISFRNLFYREKNAVEVYDFRNEKTFKNKILITCEHSSNLLHRDDKVYLNTQWAYDIGAKEMAVELSERCQLLSFHAKFSRLLIDPSRSIISKNLITKCVDGKYKLKLNSEENRDRQNRIEIFYLPYYNILGEVLTFLRPNYIISIHTFTPYPEDKQELKFEAGIIFRQKGKLVEKIETAFKENNISYKLNEPYSLENGICNAFDSMIAYRYPESTEGVILEFRNDFCKEFEWRQKIINAIHPVINKLL